MNNPVYSDADHRMAPYTICREKVPNLNNREENKGIFPAIKELQRVFIGKGEVKGFIFTQLAKSERAFLYEVDDSGRLHYEVFEKRINLRYNNVTYPKSTHFSIWAWTFRSYDKAVARFNKLSEQ